MRSCKLPSGAKMPVLGLGTWRMGEDARHAAAEVKADLQRELTEMRADIREIRDTLRREPRIGYTGLGLQGEAVQVRRFHLCRPVGAQVVRPKGVQGDQDDVHGGGSGVPSPDPPPRTGQNGDAQQGGGQIFVRGHRAEW